MTKEDKTSAIPDRASSLSRRTFLQGSAGAAAALGTSAVVATPNPLSICSPFHRPVTGLLNISVIPVL
ncbi:twin-arginine translocation signal domain-containing protein [Pseudomonadota bacterium]